MSNSYEEDVMQQSFEVATITQALAMIRNTKVDGNIGAHAVTVMAKKCLVN